MSDDSKSRLIVVSICLALTNVAITAALLASPYGEGEGGGVIGYSIVRLLVLIIPQLIVTVFGVAAAIFARDKGSGWIIVLILNLLVPIGAATQY